VSGGPTKAKCRGFFNHCDQSTVSFFFTNLPEGFKVSELWTIFLGFGKVGEVYVPLKCDPWGHRFEFVKFQEVVDDEVLGYKLGEVWLGEN